MPDFTATRSVLKAAAASHPGLQRENNEDRCHADVERGIFLVIDGVGGHAAGDRAAEIALTILRARLERETGGIAERVREAITLANNEIYDAAERDPRLRGMACVLTVAVVRDGRATIGHVGDTRLYKLQRGTIRKLTRDHSPVGDREDRGELTEREAMRHPRRNEIYRDVGTEPHRPGDPEFVDILDVEFEPESALLLCTDGLSDLVASSEIARIAAREAGKPDRVVLQLLQAAIDAGGKDNVSAVFVEGDRFAGADAAESGGRSGARALFDRTARQLGRSRWVALVVGCLFGATMTVAALVWTRQAPLMLRDLLPPGAWPRTWVVSQDGSGDAGSIGEGLARARAGDTVRVEPGEYAEHVVLSGRISLVSSVPHGAVIVPAAGERANAAVVELQGSGARIAGFRIAGDQLRPLAVGIRLRRANGEADGVEVTGARVAAIDVEGPSHPVVRGNYLHDNPGAGLVVGQAANPSVVNNVIANNGRRPDAPRPAVEVREGARPVFFGNIIVNNGIDAIHGLSEPQREDVTRDNIIGRPAAATPPGPARPRK